MVPGERLVFILFMYLSYNYIVYIYIYKLSKYWSFFSFLCYWEHAFQKHGAAVPCLKSFFLYSPYSADWLQISLFFVFSNSRLAPSVYNVFLKIRAPACNLIKKESSHRCFPINFTRFLRTLSLQNTSGHNASVFCILFCNFGITYSSLTVGNQQFTFLIS